MRTDDSEISLNGVTSSEEYEKQMTWQMEGGFHRTLSYISPHWAFQYEVNSVIEGFLHAPDGQTNYYALIHSTDSAQHLSGDIFAMMCTLDEKLQQLREVYRAREGRELEILLLSDHGNNHAGAGDRVGIRGFLKKAGYRVAKSIKNPNDVVLPTAGIESWVEIHNSPAKTETLAQLLTHLEGADVVTARLPDQTNRFLILNSKGERAILQWNPARNSFRYSPEKGDPIGYRPVVEALAKKNALDSEGFATGRCLDGRDLHPSLSRRAGANRPRPHAGGGQPGHDSRQPEKRLHPQRLVHQARRGSDKMRRHPWSPR